MDVNIVEEERRIWESEEYLIAEGLSGKLALSGLVSDLITSSDDGDSYEMMAMVLQSMNATCGSYEDLESYL